MPSRHKPKRNHPWACPPDQKERAEHVRKERERNKDRNWALRKWLLKSFR